MTVELGEQKCLAILGVSQQYYQQEVCYQGRGLEHQEVELLALEVLRQSSGEIIEKKLSALSETVGVPKQIVSDMGSDIKKGIQLYQQKHSQVIHTYDLTHAMANLLKEQLDSDEIFQSFLEHCHSCRQQLKQTSDAFLMPPAGRQRARYFNLSPLMAWAWKAIKYQQTGDFSDFGDACCLDKDTLVDLAEHLDTTTLKLLAKLQPKQYPHHRELLSALAPYLPESIICQYAAAIARAAHLGRRRCREALGWLWEFQPWLPIYFAMWELVTSVEKLLKCQGLNRRLALDWVQNSQHLCFHPRVASLRQKIQEYLSSVTYPLNGEERLLATSDVIESLFGKYKYFSSRSPVPEFSNLLLTLPLCTVSFTSSFVQKALESVSAADIDTWQEQVLGSSMLAKRTSIFHTP